MADIAGTEAQLELEEPDRGHLVVRMVGEYDLASTEVLEPKLEELLARHAASVTIDMSDLVFMDTSGVAVLLRIANCFGPVEVVGASPIIVRCIRALGLSTRLNIAGD